MIGHKLARFGRFGAIALLMMLMLGLNAAPQAQAQRANDATMQMGDMPGMGDMSGMGAQADCQSFPETGQTVCGKFLTYWTNHGGLAQQGYPISGEMQEKSATDGNTYTVQYFERAVFELHPENAAPNDVLLSLLGNFSYKGLYPDGAAGQTANSAAGSRLFAETGKHVGGGFLAYWEANGGLAQQGYPISEEFQEKSALDGKIYTVQYFERAVFESHPDNQPPYNVLLSQLGTFRYKQQYGSATPTAPTTGNKIAVDIVGLTFEPKIITIKVGDTVTWTQRDVAEHTVTSQTKIFDSPVITTVGETFSFTFTTAGTYGYYCAIHKFMIGQVIVKP